jgi:penicillin-binding protein 2
MPTRLLVLRLFMLAVLLVFGVRLAWLHLARGAELRQVSENNHLRWLRMPGPRGLIVDREGRALVRNEPRPSLWLVSGEVPRKGGYWESLLHTFVGLGVYADMATAKDALADARRFPGYQPVRLKADLSLSEITRVEERQVMLPGVYINAEPMRRYPGGTLAAHVLGYLREATAKQLSDWKEAGYRMGDPVGQVGVEQAFEKELRGTDGGQEVEVDAAGRVLRQFAAVAPQQGQTVTLTLDLDIQRAAESALAGHRGAVVVLDPQTGEVLAMASRPSYDGNQFSEHVSPALMKQVLAERALVARATQGTYPPGSVFKIVTAAAALNEGVLSASPTFFCGGEYHGIHCWNRSGHGTLGLTQAFAQSCNVAFMQMAEAAGFDPLTAMARRFGLGSPVGLGGVMAEERGWVPDKDYFSAHGRKLQLGDTLQVGIGQSALVITPLQAARLIAAIANGGRLVQPTLVHAVGKTIDIVPTATSLGLQTNTLQRIEAGLKAVTRGEGTAARLDQSLDIAGKTGTAQNPGGADHAWFVGYAPYDHPTVAIAVLIEHGGHGGAVAAPIAERVIRVALNGPAGASGQ